MRLFYGKGIQASYQGKKVRIGKTEFLQEAEIPVELTNWEEQGKRVAMVGDGINDSPALATADIGIAVSNETDIAIESADIVLIKNDLTDLTKCITISKKTVRNIKQNLFWAFGYNVLGIPIAAGILHWWGGPLLDPMLAAAAMSLSSISVLTNALRLRK